MADITLPGLNLTGDDVWGQALNDAITAVNDDAETALTNAATAQSTATSAASTATSAASTATSAATTASAASATATAASTAVTTVANNLNTLSTSLPSTYVAVGQSLEVQTNVGAQTVVFPTTDGGTITVTGVYAPGTGVWTSEFNPTRFPNQAFFTGVLPTSVTEVGGFTFTQISGDGSGVRNHPWSHEDNIVFAVATEANGYKQIRTTDITTGFAAVGAFFRFGLSVAVDGHFMPLLRFGTTDVSGGGWGVVAARRVSGVMHLSVYNATAATWTNFSPSITWTGETWDVTVPGTISTNGPIVVGVWLNGTTSKLFVNTEVFTWDATGIGGPCVEVGGNANIPGGNVHGQAGIGRVPIAPSATLGEVTSKVAELIASPGV